jgi:hypothetical protein
VSATAELHIPLVAPLEGTLFTDYGTGEQAPALRCMLCAVCLVAASVLVHPALAVRCVFGCG